jgi:RimJ/RimL family protein N-acetyltransferase
MHIKIETKRLVLRSLLLSDISQDYADWLNDPEINKYLSHFNTVQTIKTCRDYIQSYQEKKDAALIGILLKGNDLHIGNITFSSLDWDNKAVAIGISIGRKEYMGKGLASEALCAIVRYCFQQLGLIRIWAGVNISNIRSLNLFIKSGFKFDKFLHESELAPGALEAGYIMSINNKNLIAQN